MGQAENRLDRIEALTEANAKAIAELKSSIEKVDSSIEKVDIRLEAYQRSSTQVVNLAFGLLISSTVALVISAFTYYVRLLTPNA